MNLEERIGLDKVTLSNFRITEINFQKLLKHSNIELDRDGKYNYLLQNGNSFRWLKVLDTNKFGCLIAGTKINQDMKQDYSRIEIRICDIKYGNLQNKTLKEFKQSVNEIFAYIADEYGIITDISNIKISRMEINCTMFLQNKFYQYHRLFKLWMFNLPNSNKKLGQFSAINQKNKSLDNETFFRSNTLMEIKIYDKTKHLNDTKNLKITDNILRIELSLLKAQKIREIFGSNQLSKLTDEKINYYFFNQFLYLFENPYKKWKKHNLSNLQELIIKYKNKYANQWFRNMQNELCNQEQEKQIPALLDINDLFIALKTLKIEHFQRTKNSIMRQLDDTNSVYLNNDSEKANEIINKVHNIYKNFEIPLPFSTVSHGHKSTCVHL